jgi:N6-adenosine-specific RNA methylase IME4
VASWAAQRALLLLWATDPLLPRTLQVIEAWGFAHKTVGCYWVKPHASVGAVVARVVAARRARFLHPPRLLDPGQSRALPAGHALRAQAAGRRRAQAVDLTPAGHSRKPDETYARIERLLPRPYLELFARHSQPGWDGFGDQEDLFDRGPVLTRRRPSR